MNPHISVIIPAYKAENFIAQTVQTVLDQSYTDFELLIVDDGSPDDQANVIKQLEAQDNRVRYIYKENGGVSSARNLGFKQSKGQLLAFLDADDLWFSDNLEKKVQRFQEDQAFGLVHSNADVINENGQPTGEIKEGKEGYILDDLLAWNGTCIPAPSSILVKREVLEKVGLFHERLSNSADQEFFFRVAKDYKIGKVDAVTWQYRVHGNNMHSNIAVMEKDLILTYQLATENNLFKSKAFRSKCYATMYSVLGASWYGDGKNKWRGCYYLMLSLMIQPKGIGKVFKKLFH